MVNYSRGKSYLGGFVGSREEKETWVKKKEEKREESVKILASIAT